MRKNTKREMGTILLEGMVPMSKIPENACFFIDGGYLLRKYVWVSGSGYLDICHGYINYILNNHGYQSSVVFDRYDSLDSIKQAEQLRRAKKDVHVIF